MINNVAASNIYMNEKRYYISAQKRNKIKESRDHVVSSSPIAKLGYFGDKFINAFTIYPAKGLKGDRNSNFYEFLTMGMVPYTIGSLTMMGLFNYANKFFAPHAAQAAKNIGTRMALGVLLYGIAKEVSKNFIFTPVHALTGVDVNMPYQKWINEFSKSDFAPGAKNIEYHKVFESVDFPRYELLYYKKDGEPRNYYYDKVAKKLRKGDDFQAADQEIKPVIKKIVVRSKAAASLSSFLWGAVGVIYAAQESWGNLFSSGKKYVSSGVKLDAKSINSEKLSAIKNKSVKLNFKEFFENLKSIAKRSANEFWNGTGQHPRINAYTGRTILGAAILSSILGVIFTVAGAKQKNITQNSIDKNKDYVVD